MRIIEAQATKRERLARIDELQMAQHHFDVSSIKEFSKTLASRIRQLEQSLDPIQQDDEENESWVTLSIITKPS